MNLFNGNLKKRHLSMQAKLHSNKWVDKYDEEEEEEEKEGDAFEDEEKEKQGLAFRGHDESDNSSNQGNYLRILRFLADHNEDIKRITLKNAPGNNMLIAPSIQKDIVRACSIETTNAIIRDVDDALVYVLIDESRDASMKEQIAIHDINVPNMNDAFLPWGRSQRKAREISNMHYFRVELFFAVLDLQLQELNTHFNEVNMELLLCLACLCPNDTFVAFDKDKLVRLAQFYPKDFSPIELMALKTQLQTYIMDMRSSTEFAGLKGIGDLAKRMAETKKDKVYPLVYLLVTLALVLPVSTITVEITFSVMKFVKNELRNWMGDEWMNDNLIISIEKDVFNSIDNESIAQCFQNMKSHREQL
ncbi:hypothetical protein CISIN_1g046910mg [Citrus sinensis]|uniref:DUF4371 domain-containing protein n=1 Tax=Citrus sinensis TaxID=2711 RepID=A0A067DJW7_CITSI|nr:hypothetical protein CISIN_1g046910mg [Citrus sinensis]